MKTPLGIYAGWETWGMLVTDTRERLWNVTVLMPIILRILSTYMLSNNESQRSSIGLPQSTQTHVKDDCSRMLGMYKCWMKLFDLVYHGKSYSRVSYIVVVATTPFIEINPPLVPNHHGRSFNV